MAIIVGGHENGLLDTSFSQLNRDDRTSKSETGQGEQLHVNVSNGNLVLTQQDSFLPSRGADYQLMRTYNSRGAPSDAGQRNDARWDLTTSLSLNELNNGGEKHFQMTYGDGSVFEYRLDDATGLYVSTDGQGAYETLEDLGAKGNASIFFIVTRADQSRLSFNSHGDLVLWEDTNGVSMEYHYSQNRLVEVRDDEGHVLTYNYAQGNLVSIADENEGILVQYRYSQGRMSEVQDRFGHVTKYFYSNDGFLIRVVLPNKQQVDGTLETYDSREINFEYESVNWSNGDSGRAKVLTRMVDAEGNITTFDYNFDLRNDNGGDTPTNGAGSGNGNGNGVGNGAGNGNGNGNGGNNTDPDDADKFYDGGSTRVVDALGNARSYSNDAIYQQWRTENGYYATYNANAVANDAALALQVEEIRSAHSLTYSYQGDGYITAVVDQQQFRTSYAYDAKGNLLSVTDRNGWGAVNSDSAYYRDLRESLGFPRPLDSLIEDDKIALTALFTSTFTYDERGNVLSSTDNTGNTTVFSYTSFNKLETVTSANSGVTSLSYDARQNLIEQVDPSGDVTRWEYDSYGNQVKRTVYLDQADLTDPAKQQVTEFFYDLFGNNVRTVDAEGYETFNSYDHFGNLTQSQDANGGVTSHIYDADNRLLSSTDAESHTTVNTYDAVGNRISFTDANGKTVTYIYDRNNRLISTIDPAASAPQTRTTDRQYDVVGNQVAVTDAEGRTTTYNFNARREVVEVVTSVVKGADGATDVQYSSSYAYDGEGNGIRLTDNRGNSTEFLYQQDGLLRRETNAIGHITQYHYDANRNVLTVIAGAQLAPSKQQKLSFAYDSEDQILTSTDAENNVTRYSYDAPGTIASVTDGNDHRTDFEYDLENRLIREIRPELVDPDTGAVLPRYEMLHRLDGNGNEIETVDENGNSTFFSFNLDNRLVRVEDANGIVTTYAYDPNHNLTRVVIGQGSGEAQVTSFVYDEFNQLIAETDGVGNALAESNEPLYQKLRQELQYAEDTSLLSTDDKNALRNMYTERYAYDRVGNLLSVQDHLGRVTQYDYDSLDRLVLQTDALGNTQLYRYDGNDNLVSEVDELNRGRGYTYDAVDRQTQTENPLGSLTQSVYDDFGNLVQRTEAAGDTIERESRFEYDLNNLLVREIDPENHQVAYEYDAVGNRVKVTDGRFNSTQILYDAMDRNIKVIDPLNFATRFEYDGVGKQIKTIDPRGGDALFTYDPGNRIIASQDAEGRRISFEYDKRGNLVTQTTAVGTSGVGSAGPEVTRFEYDAENNLRAMIDAEGGRTEYEFDAVYNEIAVIDANLHTTSTSYDALNRAVKVKDAAGGETVFIYDAVGNTLSVEDPLNRVTTYTYADDDQLLVVRDAAGVETHYVNDVFGNISITRAANIAGQERTRHFEYNGDGELVAETDELGGVKRYQYDANHNVTLVTDENQHSTRYIHDANNQVIEIIDALLGSTTFTYDGNGNRTSVTNDLGHTSTAYYNGNDDLVLAVNALGYATSSNYDDNGNLITFTEHVTRIPGTLDPASQPTVQTSVNDHTTRYEYDALNQLVKLIDAMGGEKESSYDAVGNQKTRTDENDGVTLYTYDNLDRLVEIENPLHGLRSYSYDAVGNRLTDTDENRHTITFTYDLLDRQLSSTDAMGGERLNTYDAVGNQLTARDENEHTTHFSYDKLDRQITRTNAADDIARFSYDKVGNQRSFTDENGDITTNTYDALDRLVETEDPLLHTVTYVFDGFGNEIERIDEANNSTFVTYDALGRITERTDTEGGIRKIAYDAVGNMISEQDETGNVTEFAFDLNNRLVSLTSPLNESQSFTYDAVGNKLTEKDERGYVTDYRYDVLNRLVEMKDALGEKRNLDYDAVGNLLQETDARGNSVTSTFDANNRATALLSREGYLSTFSYDKVGNQLLRNEYNEQYVLLGDGTLPPPNGSDTPRITEFVYDVLNRLERQTDASGLSTHYAYDKVGNALGMFQSGKSSGLLPGGNVKVRYDENGRVIRREDADGVVTVLHLDSRGNVLRKIEAETSTRERTTTYTYDRINRLKTETNDLGTTVSFTYDKADRMLTRTTSGTGVADRVERFEYNENGLLALEVNGAGGRTTYDYDASGNLETVTFGEGSTEQYVNRSEYDELGRLTAEIDGEGIKTSYKYDENGNKIETIQVDGDPGAERHTLYTYDAQNRLRTIQDPMQLGVTEYQYDAQGNQFRIIGADGTVTENTFDDAGQILTNTVAVGGEHGGARTTNTYDDRGNVLSTSIQYVDGSAPARTTTYEYDVLDRITRVTDPEGFSSSFAYDEFGNQTRVSVGEYIDNPADPDNDAKALRESAQTSIFTYDAADQLTRSVDGEGNAVSSTYDLHGNRITQTTGIATATSNDAAHQSTASFKYDLDGQLIQKTSSSGARIEITRNAIGQQEEIKTLQSTGKFVVEQYQYDNLGRVSRLTDSYGVSEDYSYDGVGNLLSVSRFGGRVTHFTYDLNNNLITEKDPGGATTTFAYDLLGQLVKETDALGGERHSYYNDFNQLIGATDAENHFTALELDIAGNALKTTLYATKLSSIPADGSLPATPAASSADRVISQTWDQNGKRLSETRPNGTTLNFSYDSVGQLREQVESVTGAGNILLDRTQDQADRTMRWDWDDAGRVVEFVNVDGVRETYTYDAANNRVTETVTDPNVLVTTGAVDHVRTTSFGYDLANRVTSQTIGTNIQTLGYDFAGNVINKTDALGNITTTSYDLNNRLTQVRDALNQTISYEYDELGNLDATTDGLGNRTTQDYDLNDRVETITAPSATLYTIGGGQVVLASTRTNDYDKLGNLIEVTDESGHKTTTWYNNNGNVIAEVNGDLRLQKYSYNAFGEILSVTTYQEKVADSPASRDPNSVPSSNADSTVVTNEYDRMGNIVRTEYPPIEVSTVTHNGSSANVTTATLVLEDQSGYNAWGDLVESVDRKDVHSYSYYDTRGRLIASIDGGGYLIASAYDSEANVVRQSKYETPVSSATADTLPATPSGAVHAVDRYYDEQGQLVREVSPEISISGGSAVRVATTFGYDAAGNLKVKVLASGAAEQQSEYYYYDSIGQRTATVASNRVLNSFSFDANGNMLSQSRFITPLASSVNLAAASTTSASLLGAVTRVSGEDQTTSYRYNELNLLSRQTVEMGSDDIVSRFWYDASGNLTRKIGAENFVSEVAYDASNHIIQTIAPNGGHSFIEYNVVGQKTSAWTGGDPSQTAPPTDSSSIAATTVNGSAAAVAINWQVPPSAGSVTSWVAWDTSAHTNLPAGAVPSSNPGNAGEYSNATAASALGSQRSASIPVTGLTPGQELFFRVVIKDAANNLSWSEERTVIVPVTLSSVEISQSGSDYVVEVDFNGAVTNPRVISDSLADVGMTQVSGTRYQATLSGVSSPAALALGFAWSSVGEDYATSTSTLLQAPDAAVDPDNGTISWILPFDGSGPVGDHQLLIVDGVLQAADTVHRVVKTLQFTPAAGVHNYDIFYGEGVAEAHSFRMDFTDNQTLRATRTSYNRNSDNDIVSTNWAMTWHSGGDGAIQSTVGVVLDAAELARVNGNGVKVAYRQAADDGVFTTEKRMTGGGGNLSAILDLAQGTDYDLKIYYVDNNGDEVIVEWRRVTVPNESSPEVASPASRTTAGKDNKPSSDGNTRNRSVAGSIAESDLHSLTVLASERDGSFNDNSVTPGLYTGPIDPTRLAMALDLEDTGGADGSHQANGLADKTYYTLIEYNAMGDKTGSNEDTGLWRTYGVDATGNVVVTRTYGEEDETLSSIDTYAFYDDRDLEVRELGPIINGQAAETLTNYDYNGRVESQRQPGDTLAYINDYDGVGNLLSETNALGDTVYYAYDRLGNAVEVEDAEGHVQRMTYTYSGVNANQHTSTSYVGLSTANESYNHDGFGRRTSVTNGAGNVTEYGYDQNDRVTTITDPLGHVTRNYYDKRDKQIWVEDANGNFFGRAYNGVGLATNEYAFVTAPTSLAAAKAAVAANSDNLINEQVLYDVFNNKYAKIDAEGNSTSFSYGAFGRIVAAGDISYSYTQFGRQDGEIGLNGRNITRSYDDAGRLTQVNDVARSTRTDYSYDVAGQRKTEVLTISGVVHRSQTYTWDDQGQLLKWRDTAPSTAISLDYRYFADGNIRSISDGSATTTYAHDAADRLTRAGGESYTYDSAGNRATAVVGSETVSYTYNTAGWVTNARLTNSDVTNVALYSWSHDDAGNVTQQVHYDTDGSELEKTVSTYNGNYLGISSVNTTTEGRQTTNTTFDRSGKILSTQSQSLDLTDSDAETQTYNYSYDYGSDDLVDTITGSGPDDLAGSSVSTYDVNGGLTRVNLGQGDGQERDETNSFVRDNDGKIISATRDDGKEDTTAETTHYLYAVGYAAGEYTDATDPTLNEGNYATVKTLSPGFEELPPTFPDTTIIQHTVLAGETLKSIAARYYGSPDLWFVIAEANGLSVGAELQAGSRLVVPNSPENAYQTSDTHTLYKEGDIVGSKLPNLATPPPSPGDICAIIAAIILIIIVAIAAIVLTIVTVGVAAPAAAAALGGVAATTVGTVIVGIAVGAVVGAAIAFAASVLTQGILVGFGLQEEFDWKAVAADVVAGLFGGAAAGLGAAFSAAKTATTLLKVINVVGQIALETAGEAAAQAIQNDGEITNPGLIVAAGVGGAFGGIADIGSRTLKASKKVAAAAAEADSLAKSLTKAGAEIGGAGVTATLSDAAKAAADSAKSLDEVADAARKANKSVFAAVFKAQWAEVSKPFVKEVKNLAELPKRGLNAIKEFSFQKTIAKGEFTKTVEISKLVKGKRVLTETKFVVRKSATTVSKSESFKFVRILDDANVVKIVQVNRKSVAGTSIKGGLKIIGDNLKSIFVPGRINNVVDAGKDIKKSFSKAFKAIKAFKADDVVTKGVNTKVVRVTTKLSGGSKAFDFQVVARNSSGTLLERIPKVAKQLGTKIAGGTTDSVKAAYKSGALAKKVGTYGKTATSWVDFFIRDKGRDGFKRNKNFGTSLNLGKILSPFGKFQAPALGLLNRGFLPQAAQWLDTATGSVFRLHSSITDAPTVESKFGIKPRQGPAPLDDRNGLVTHTELHNRQHNWLALDWTNVAANTTTQVHSPFGIDQSATARSTLASHQLASGQVKGFDLDAIVDYAERSVGGVGGDVGKVPNLVS